MNEKNYKRIGIIGLLLYSLSIYAQDAQGFIPDEWKPKKASIPKCEGYKIPETEPTVYITIDPSDVIAKVSQYIYGNNVNVYMTQMVDQYHLLQYLSLLSPNILRYPGGNLSNLFFWNAKPEELPDDVPGTLWGGIEKPYIEEFWFGRNTDTFTLTVDNYYKMLDMVGATGIITINYSYARYSLSNNPAASAAHMAAEWVRYDKGRTKYWEIGNENYGPWQAGHKIDTTQNKDGQPEYINGELYGTHFKIFADSMRAAAKEVGNDIKLGASIVEADNSWSKDPEKYWNEGFFRTAGNAADFFILHSYYTPYKQNSDVPTILNSAAQNTKAMRDFVIQECEKYEVELKPLALTEWNIFAIHSKQSCSYINGIHSVLVLGELIKNKYGLACRWNLANAYADGNDHGMFSKGDEPGVPKWNPRPVYFYMYYFQRFFGDHIIGCKVEGDEDIVAYASRFSSGEYGLVIVNKGTKEHIINIHPFHGKSRARYYLYCLTGGNDNGDFSQKVFINNHPPTNVNGGPIDDLENIKAWSSRSNQSGVQLKSPPYSVQYILIDE